MYIGDAGGNQVITAPLMVGSTLPSHCTSMGRILLSALSVDLREEWLSHTVLDPRTERTIVSADALRAELDIVESGSASCRDRVCQYVYVSVVAVSLKTTNPTPNKHQTEPPNK